MRRILTALAVASLVLLAAPSAHAAVSEPYERTDASNDVPYLAGDIHKIRIGYTDTLRLSVYVRAVNRESDSPEWTNPNGRTNIVWQLLADPGPSVDYRVRLFSRASGPTVEVRDGNGNQVVCAVVVTFGNPARYTIAISPGCLGDASSFRARATFTFKPVGRAASVDTSPGNGFTPAVLRSV